MLSSRHPALYRLSVLLHRLQRYGRWYFGWMWGRRYARQPRSVVTRPENQVRLLTHRSLLLRWLAGVDMALQHNKVTNLRLACGRIDGVVLRLRNPGPQTFELRVWVDYEFLHGEIWCDETPSYSYHVIERGHHFWRDGDRYYRENEIWRRMVNRATGATVREKLIAHNFALLRYRSGPETRVEDIAFREATTLPVSGNRASVHRGLRPHRVER